ncbi:MAG TPA: aminoacyl-tRNA hydrolase [Bacteroidales bacterium]|nr:aminoacyl-tRNA hydrolase [Bacteroidales bacterium]
MKYLIVGLGNIGDEYHNTRHNIGFTVLDALAKASNICFEDKRYGAVAEYKFKGRTFILLKPSTYMNLSGKAVNYWLKEEKIPTEHLFVIVDDLALPLGALRIRPKGSDGGHNGLKNINEVLGTQDYARLRFGIGNEFPKGAQVNFVLNRWTKEEEELLNKRVPVAVEMIKSFGTIGLQLTMTQFNNK